MMVNTNMAALNTLRQGNISEKGLEKSLQRLSSGLRIVNAADDAAGLTISEKLKGQVNGLNRAAANAQDGINMFQTAEGALVETGDILQRMRELAVQGANETLTASDRVEIQKEVNQLSEEIDRIANTTEFNTKKLLDGSASGVSSINNSSKNVDIIMNGVVQDGNYNISVETEAGKNQVLQSNVFTTKEARTTSVKEVSIANSGSSALVSATIADSNDVVADQNIKFEFVQGKAAESVGNALTLLDGEELEEIDAFVLTGALTLTMVDAANDLDSTLTIQAGTYSGKELAVRFNENQVANAAAGLVSSVVNFTFDTANNTIVISGTATAQLTHGGSTADIKFFGFANSMDLDANTSVTFNQTTEDTKVAKTIKGFHIANDILLGDTLIAAGNYTGEQLATFINAETGGATQDESVTWDASTEKLTFSALKMTLNSTGTAIATNAAASDIIVPWEGSVLSGLTTLFGIGANTVSGNGTIAASSVSVKAYDIVLEENTFYFSADTSYVFQDYDENGTASSVVTATIGKGYYDGDQLADMFNIYFDTDNGAGGAGTRGEISAGGTNVNINMYATYDSATGVIAFTELETSANSTNYTTINMNSGGSDTLGIDNVSGSSIAGINSTTYSNNINTLKLNEAFYFSADTTYTITATHIDATAANQTATDTITILKGYYSAEEIANKFNSELLITATNSVLTAGVGDDSHASMIVDDDHLKLIWSGVTTNAAIAANDSFTVTFSTGTDQEDVLGLTTINISNTAATSVTSAEATETVKNYTDTLAITQGNPAKINGLNQSVELAAFTFTSDATFKFTDGGSNSFTVTVTSGRSFSGGQLVSWLNEEINDIKSAVDITASYTVDGFIAFADNGADTDAATIQLNSAAAAALGFSTATTTLNTAGTTLIGSRSATQTKLFTMDLANSEIIKASAEVTYYVNDIAVNFTLSGVSHTATTTITSTNSLQAQFTEQQILDRFNNAFDTANAGIRAEIDNGYLNFVASTDDGEQATSQIVVRISAYYTATAEVTRTAYATAGLFGIDQQTARESGNSKIKFSVNGGDIYTANITAGSYTADTPEGRQELAAEIEEQMNAVIENVGDKVDVFVDDDAQLHITTRKVGTGSGVTFYQPEGANDALGTLGLAVSDSAKGNDEGIALVFKDADTNETIAVYNRRNASDAAYSWTAQGSAAGSATVNDNNSELAGLKLVFSSAIATVGEEGNILVSHKAAGEEDYVARSTDKLSTLANFYDNDGNFILEETQKLTLYTKDGNTADIYLDGEDTLSTVATKFKDAMTNDIENGGLGMSTGTTENDKGAAQFLSNVKGALANLEGSILLSSTLAGEQGELSIEASDAVLSAFGFNTAQEAENNSANIIVTDAGGSKVGETTISGETAKGLIAGIDMKVDVNNDVSASYNSSTGEYGFDSKAGRFNVKLHVVDSSTDLHIGANKGQKLNAAISRMDSQALGIKGLSMINAELSNNAIEKVDNAINRVSSERSKLGSYINRLEHTIRNLGVESENLNATRSGIEDLDMAAEMVNFTKDQVLSQGANTLLSQANALPQNVLSLLR